MECWPALVSGSQPTPLRVRCNVAMSILNEDCYGAGWMYKIKPDDMGEVEDLIHGVAAIEQWLLADIEKYKK